MDMMKRIKIILLALALMPMVLMAQSTRADLAKIRVGKDGNFKYWEKNSNAVFQLKKFVARVTDESSTDFVPVQDRIATFDVDGTLLCETAPYYMNWMMCFYRYLHDDSYTADPADRARVAEMEEYVLKNHKDDGWGTEEQQLQAKAFRGLTQEEFSESISKFLNNASPIGLSNLTWGTALYWPMIEAVSYLVANDFKVYLCSGVDRDVCRVLTKDIYDIPVNQMITSDVNYVMEGQAAKGEWTENANSESYSYTPGEKVVRGDFKQLCTAVNKIVIIRRELGKKPILSWGNSSGDFPMFHYTNQDNPLPHISFCLICDDQVREFGNPAKAEKCRTACEENGWVAVSMKNEWTTIYGDDVVVTGVTSAKADAQRTSSTYSISGQTLATPKSNEVYIEDGKKKVNY